MTTVLRYSRFLTLALLLATMHNAALAAEAPAVPENLKRVVFANRAGYDDGHWYANIGYYCNDATPAYAGNGKPANGRLNLLDVTSGEVTVLVDAQGGAIRDPVVHYDGRKVLFSWRKDGSAYYNLYEIDIDGKSLRQITSGAFDDFEPCYLPDDDIVFVSTRCRCWVNCWKTQVGTLYRCRADGTNIHPISSNIEHDNTPAVMPDGRLLYTRWEYVDRSQMGYHHLWTINPDGTGQMTFFGNQRHSPLYIDARPIPGENRVVAIDSPGHGRSDHRGLIVTIDVASGPDADSRVTVVTKKNKNNNFCDPFPLSSNLFLAALGKRIVLVDGEGTERVLCTTSENCHEPRPVWPRPREPLIPSRTNATKTTGQLFLADVYHGRNLTGVRQGEIRKLLVLESLPKPVNFSGGQDQLSWLGTFTLERVLGTVPVEEDGSAFFEVPANRPVIFVALDQRDLSVKRMQSFTSVMPGETTSCVGCHEQRTEAPRLGSNPLPMAARRPASRIEPFAGFPDVLDFPRDIQPVLDRNCTSCHNSEKRDGNVSLEGDIEPEWSLSYHTLIARLQIADGRNGLGNQPPRTIGSSASRLMRKLEGGHYDVKASPRDWRTVWLWQESGAPYAGTYAALRNEAEMAAPYRALGPAFHALKLVGQRRCNKCHGQADVPAVPLHIENTDKRSLNRPTAQYERRIIENDPLARFSPKVLFSLSRPERSAALLAPLAASAGGWGACPGVFADRDDADYRLLLDALRKGHETMLTTPQYGMPGFHPNAQYVREMVRYGILPEGAKPADIDPYATDQKYWRAFWSR